MKSACSTAARILIFVALFQAGMQTARLIQHQVSEPGKVKYISITGCNSHCEIACCYCNIMADPPMCLQCCEESP
uniref:Uncharacterized protein n=1 Tax=Kalanchoe fedtschenkoi TaxID=63787 RepID=A0A7N0UAX2_KALFE